MILLNSKQLLAALCFILPMSFVSNDAKAADTYVTTFNVISAYENVKSTYNGNWTSEVPIVMPSGTWVCSRSKKILSKDGKDHRVTIICSNDGFKSAVSTMASCALLSENSDSGYFALHYPNNKIYEFYIFCKTEKII